MKYVFLSLGALVGLVLIGGALLKSGLLTELLNQDRTEYDYVENLDLVVAMIQLDYQFFPQMDQPVPFGTDRQVVIRKQLVFGHLDAAGNFTIDRDIQPLDAENLVVGDGAINSPRCPDEAVYEFRSGSLIAGTLDELGNFIPEEGEEVIAFKDYHFNKKARRIYNLPGMFVERPK
jgi:hypothetical protein